MRMAKNGAVGDKVRVRYGRLETISYIRTEGSSTEVKTYEGTHVFISSSKRVIKTKK